MFSTKITGGSFPARLSFYTRNLQGSFLFVVFLLFFFSFSLDLYPSPSKIKNSFRTRAYACGRCSRYLLYFTANLRSFEPNFGKFERLFGNVSGSLAYYSRNKKRIDMFINIKSRFCSDLTLFLCLKSVSNFPKYASNFPNVYGRMRDYYGKIFQTSGNIPEQSPKLPECLRKNVPNFPNNT